MPNSTRISLDEAQGLPDALADDNFRLNLGSLPGGGDGSPLSIKAQNAVIPGRTNESFEVSFGGFMRNFSGKNTFPRVFGITYSETIDLQTFSALRNWLEQIRGTESGTSIGNIADYSVEAELSLFDQAGNEIDTITFRNLYITGIQDTPLQNAQSQVVSVQAEFRYDVAIYSGIEQR